MPCETHMRVMVNTSLVIGLIINFVLCFVVGVVSLFDVVRASTDLYVR